jgi:hypothetical protein
MINFIKNNQKYFTIGGACILLLLTAQQRSQIKELKIEREELTKHMVDSHGMTGGDIGGAKLTDSLNDELFNSKSMNGRYELSLQHLYEVNPKAAKEFDDYLNHETE